MDKRECKKLVSELIVFLLDQDGIKPTGLIEYIPDYEDPIMMAIIESSSDMLYQWLKHNKVDLYKKESEPKKRSKLQPLLEEKEEFFNVTKEQLKGFDLLLTKMFTILEIKRDCLPKVKQYLKENRRLYDYGGGELQGELRSPSTP